MRILQHEGRMVIFVHVAKAAGNAISRALDAAGAQAHVLSLTDGHATAQDILNVIGAKAWEEALSFAVVRHPYTQRASQWTELRKPGPTCPDLPAWMPTFREWILWAGRADPSPWESAEILPYWRNAHWPQSFFLSCPSRWRQACPPPLVKHVLHFERLAEEWSAFVRDRDLPVSQTLDVVNYSSNRRAAGGSDDYLSWYDDEMKVTIHRVYHQDFDAFGYEP